MSSDAQPRPRAPHIPRPHGPTAFERQPAPGGRELTDLTDLVERLFSDLHDRADLLTMIGVVRECVANHPHASAEQLELAVRGRLSTAAGGSPAGPAGPR